MLQKNKNGRRTHQTIPTRFLSILLVFLLTFSLVIPALASGTDSETESEQTVEIIEAIQKRDVIATKQDVLSCIIPLMSEKSQSQKQNKEKAQLMMENMEYPDDLATVDYFLEQYTNLLDNRFCQEKDGAYYYPAGDSMWMSAEEWAALTEDVTEFISLETVRVIVERTQESIQFLEEHKAPVTYEEYVEVVDAFFRNFSSLVHENETACTYWVEEGLASYKPYNYIRFSSVLHEMSHEQSAKKANSFNGRRLSERDWFVDWSKRPSSLYLYNISVGEYETLEMPENIVKLNAIDKNAIPQNVKDTAFYSVYFANTSLANVYGIYGAMEEFSAYAIDMEVRAISCSIKYNLDSFYDIYVAEYYFWKGVLFHYLDVLQEKRSNEYNLIMSDKQMMSLLVDTFSGIETLLYSFDIYKTVSGEVSALRDWADDEEVQYIAQKILSASGRENDILTSTT